MIFSELYVSYIVTINNFKLLIQAYNFKKDLVKKFSCEICDYVETNYYKILLIVFLISVLAGSTGIGIGILAIFLFSKIGLSPYVSFVKINLLFRFLQ